MKLLTVKINEGIDHIINFESKISAKREFVVESFTSDVPLITFYPVEGSNTAEHCFYCQTDNDELEMTLKGIKVINESYPNDSNECVDVHLEAHFVSGEDVEDFDCDNGWNSTTCTYTLPLHDVNLCYRVKVDVILTIIGTPMAKGKTKGAIGVADRQYRESFTINVAPAANIFDAVLDFGSEASQILIFWRGKNMIGNDLFPIYSGFKRYFGDSIDNDSNVLQYEKNNTSLYKSHFFIPKVIDTSVQYNPAVCPKDTQLMKFFTPLNTLDELRKEYVTLHNVKIAAYGGVQPPQVKSKTGEVVPVKSFQKNYFYRASVNSFVYQILDHIANDMQAPQPRFLVLYALVPNIYSQPEVSDYLNALRTDAQEMINSDSRMKDLIKGVSISSVSESDASFLGFMSACPLESNSLESGEYLIMDAGKGTLDFSIIDFNASRVPCVKGVYRSGIVGAGNAISYAFLLAILKQIYSGTGESDAAIEHLIDSFIKEKIHNGDESEIYELMKLVEQYKRLYNDGVLNNDWIGGLSRNNLKLEVSGLINSLNQNILNHSMLHDVSIIDAMMNNIADNAIEKLSYRRGNNVKKVIFTGRGFRMKAFKELMMDKLCELDGYDDLEEICIDEDKASMKSVCLFILPYLNQNRYDGLMVGEPDILHHGDTTLTQHQPKVDKISKARKKAIRYNSLMKVVRSVFGGDDNNSGEIYIETDNNYINGVVLNAKTPQDKIMISGNFYQLRNMQEGRLSVFFDGETFYARQNSRLLAFGPSVDIQKRMDYESMFPYAECAEDIPIPHMNEAVESKTNAVKEARPAPPVEDGLTDDELVAKLKGLK